MRMPGRIAVLGALGVLTLLAAAPTSAAQRPNIVFFLADDLGWRDLGCYGSTFYSTPNIDGLAAQGVRFTQAYTANPLCSPTRASILTGLWPSRIGITSPVCHVKDVILEEKLPAASGPAVRVLSAISATRLKQEYVTIAEALQTAGYRTGHFGKWHLGAEPYDPLRQGFEVDFPHWPGPGPAGSYIAPWRFPEDLIRGKEGEHIEDRVAEQAVKFIRDNKDRPFFLNYWLYSVHEPWQGKPELVQKYAAAAAPKNPQHNPVYAAMVQSMDEAVGTVLRELEAQGLMENTIVIFTSDNGGVNWHEPRMKQRCNIDDPPTSNLPLRGGKASIYEGGTRVPWIVRWPGVTRAGASSDAVIQSIDMFPTILDMLGLPAPAGMDQKFDGISIVPAIKGETLSRDAIFCHFPHAISIHENNPSSYVRQGDFKLIRFYCGNEDLSDRHELYNLKEDIGEARDLAATMPDKVKKMSALLDKFLTDSHSVIPIKNPHYNAGIAGVKPYGWIPSWEMKAGIEEGTLVLESTGNDPQLVASITGVAGGPYSFEVRLWSTSKGQAQVFWQTNEKQPFFRDRSVYFQPQHDGQWHEYAVKLPPTRRLENIRFDPSTAPGLMKIQWLRLRDGEGKVIKEWRFDRKPE